MNKGNLYTAISIGIVSSLFATVIFVALNATALPDVYVSYSSGECVRVVNYDPDHSYTCEDYPSKYNHVWVQ